MLVEIYFYIFAAVMVGSSLMVIGSRNPVHSVFFLILAFFNAAGTFLLVGAEFVAMILVIVYVGAVAVLFLFVVMMLDIKAVDTQQNFIKHLPVGLVAGGILLLELIIVIGQSALEPTALMAAMPMPPADQLENTKALGQVLYTNYFLIFQGSGLVLLVAMIGAILLTMRKRPDVRRQSVHEQVTRTVDESMAIRKVDIGSGA